MIKWQGQDLKYSNRTAEWVVWVERIIYIMVVFLGIGAMLLAVYMFMKRDWLGGILSILVGAGIGWSAWFIRISRKLNRENLIEAELRDNGYFISMTNTVTGVRQEQFIPFSRMKDVTVGRISQYVSRGADESGYYIIAARLVMRFEDEEGNLQFSLFTEVDSDNLNLWIQKFQAGGVTIYSTHVNIGGIKTEDYPAAYEEIPKVLYGTNSPPDLGIGELSDRALPRWESTAMRKKKEKQQAKYDNKYRRPLSFVIAILNFLCALLWMPVWTIEDSSFAESSPFLYVRVVNLILLLLEGTYWREQIRWHRPLLQVGVVAAVQLVGFSMAVLIGSTDTLPIKSIVMDNVNLIILLYIVFGVVRLLRSKN
ncbi:hypothetical protein [Paenibacillus caui]|uniref:hypothetical protein n=1 Tax=Paenibacillus caui TaxID=2873927 RepID=UPI001CA86B25|nr:hypothetical protein [Paenibacillus caui]